MERKQSRKRLRPFLELHCNANTFRGLRWIDKDKKIFCITWIHQTNKVWDAWHGAIFKAWAIYTGKHREGEPECYPEWKTRLRTALTKLSDIKELKDLHNLNDAENSYKVYQFLSEEEASYNKMNQQGPPSAESGYADSSSSSCHPSPASQMDFLNHSDNELNDTGTGNSDGYAMCGMAPIIPTVVDDVCSPNQSLADAEESRNLNVNFPQALTLALPSCNTDKPPNFLHEMDATNAASEKINIIPSDLQSIDSGNLFNSETCISIGSYLPNLDSFSSMGSINNAVWEVKVFFVDQCMLTEPIDEQGARLFCGDLSQQIGIETFTGDRRVFGPLELKQISIPEVDKILLPSSITEKQKQLILSIQRNMDRGLLLGGTNSEVFAQRLCKARVFAWTQERVSKHLNREDNSPVCVFELELFKQQLNNYILLGGTPPSPSVMFTFGQEYKADSPDVKHVLLYARVTHMEARKLLDEVLKVKEKNSLPDVFISDPNSLDQMVDLMKDRLSIT